jgi:type IV secretory pathway TrbF-like protein
MRLTDMLSERRNGIDATLDTPALAGKRNHETLYGSLARNAYSWRLACFVLLAVVLWDRIELHQCVAEKHYVPYVIAEHDDGATRYLGIPDPTWKPTDRNIIAEVKWLVQTIRGRTTDAKFDRKLWQMMVDRSTERGRIQLGQAYGEQEALPEKGRIEVEIISINKGSDQTFDVRWQERRHDIAGALVGTPLRFRGLFTEVLGPLPHTEAELAKNEKGVWHDGWSIAREER